MSKESWEIGRDVYTYKSNMDNLGGIVMLIFLPLFIIIWLLQGSGDSVGTEKKYVQTEDYDVVMGYREKE